MKMKKMICAAFCGLAVLIMAGCGELKPDQVNRDQSSDYYRNQPYNHGKSR